MAWRHTGGLTGQQMESECRDPDRGPTAKSTEQDSRQRDARRRPNRGRGIGKKGQLLADSTRQQVAHNDQCVLCCADKLGTHGDFAQFSQTSNERQNEASRGKRGSDGVKNPIAISGGAAQARSLKCTIPDIRQQFYFKVSCNTPEDYCRNT
jgi:hypothetical protein